MRNRRSELLDNICTQMLKGTSGVLPEMSEEQRSEFCEKWEPLANEIADLLPPTPDGTYSSGLGAVMCKCAIYYGKDKAKKFLETLRHGTFQGVNDPVRRYWLYWTKSKGQTPNDMYCRAIPAVRAFCEGRTLTELRPSTTDIFGWNKSYTAPKKLWRKRLIFLSEVRFYDDRNKVREYAYLSKVLYHNDDICLCVASLNGETLYVLFDRVTRKVLTENLQFWIAENYQKGTLKSA